MPLILAIEPDRRQASCIEEIAREQLRAELIVIDSTPAALHILANRTPDLILTSFLLSPREEAHLTDRLRELDGTGGRVQTLVIPVLSAPKPTSERGGLFTKLGFSKKKPVAADDGCDPAVFGAQIAEYLDRAAAERRSDRAPVITTSANVAADSTVAEPKAGQLDPLEATALGRRLTRFLPEATLPVAEPAGSPFIEAAGEHDARDLTADAEDDGVVELDRPADELSLALFVSESVDQPQPDTQSEGGTSRAELASATTLGDEGWKDLGLPPRRRATDAVKVLEPTLVVVDSGDAGLVVSAESIDLAAFVADLKPMVEDDTDVEPDETPAAETDQSEEDVAPASAPSLELASSVNQRSEAWSARPVGYYRGLPSIEGILAENPGLVSIQPGQGAVAARALRTVPSRARPAKKNHRGKRKKQRTAMPPAQSEWGFFDPEQCGFAALITKLEEISDSGGAPGPGPP